MSITKAITVIEGFQGGSLTKSLAKIESEIVGADAKELAQFYVERDINDSFIESAFANEKVAGQINVIIHAAGILQSLIDLLQDGEVVESVSLGAGNTGRKFDLETNRRVAGNAGKVDGGIIYCSTQN